MGKVTAEISSGSAVSTVDVDFDRSTRIECVEDKGDCTGPEAEDPEGTPVGEPQRSGGLAVTIRKWDITGGPGFLKIHVLISVEALAEGEKTKLKVFGETKKEFEAGGGLGKGGAKFEDEVKVDKKSGKSIEEVEINPREEYYKSFEQSWIWRCKSGLDEADTPEVPKEAPKTDLGPTPSPKPLSPKNG